MKLLRAFVITIAALATVFIAAQILMLGFAFVVLTGGPGCWFDDQERMLRRVAAETQAAFPDVAIRIEVEDFYRNIREVLKDQPYLVEDAVEATRRAGLTPTVDPIRGGTDGTSLTFRGLPTPDLFTGGYNFHSKQEFNSRRGLEKTSEMLVHLVQIVADRSPGAAARDV